VEAFKTALVYLKSLYVEKSSQRNSSTIAISQDAYEKTNLNAKKTQNMSLKVKE